MSTVDFDPDDNANPQRQRWQEELAEILAAADRESTPVEKVRGKVMAARYQTPEKSRSLVDRVRESWSPGMWIILFVGFILLTVAVQHFSPLLGRVFALIAVVMLIAILLRGFRRGSSRGSSQMWRGKDMSLDPGKQSWFERTFGKRD
ncbi:MAG: hypothetical protein IT335_07270 [Thermomicrobiales bacterium]|nr:hypothetical protein [Thermomicrobiales bacterium]